MATCPTKKARTIVNDSLLMAQSADLEQLKPDTLLAYTEYIRAAEAAMDETLTRADGFLWSDGSAERSGALRKGLALAQLWSGKSPIKVPSGLIHDWIGAIFTPGATVAKTLALIQDYDNHKNIYKPEVIDSKLINQHGNHFEIYLRLLKKKVITVVLDTYHEVDYSSVDPLRWRCRSYTRRISEVDDAGKKGETVQPPDTGNGFMWRLYSYWRFLERDRGVYVECRAISLTRDVPRGLGWVIEPIIKKLPRESLLGTLQSTLKGTMDRGT